MLQVGAAAQQAEAQADPFDSIYQPLLWPVQQYKGALPILHLPVAPSHPQHLQAAARGQPSPDGQWLWIVRRLGGLWRARCDRDGKRHDRGAVAVLHAERSAPPEFATADTSHPVATTRGCLQASDRAAAWSTSLRCTSLLPCRRWAAFTLVAPGLQTYSAAGGRLCWQGPRVAGMCTQWSGALTRSAPHARELVQLALEACGGAVLPSCLPQSSMRWQVSCWACTNGAAAPLDYPARKSIAPNTDDLAPGRAALLHSPQPHQLRGWRLVQRRSWRGAARPL